MVYGHLITLGPEKITQLIGNSYRTVPPAGTTDPDYQVGFSLLNILREKKDQKIPGFCQESGCNRPFQNILCHLRRVAVQFPQVINVIRVREEPDIKNQIRVEGNSEIGRASCRERV